MKTRNEKIIEEFIRIRNLGFVPSNRPNNKDGGIGNTFEDHLGVKENNLKDPDFEGFEVKSQREFNSSHITLFSKSPSYPRRANALLKDRYGEARDSEFPNLKKLYASIFGHRDSHVYEKYLMRLAVNREVSKLILNISDLSKTNIYNDVYWNFDSLMRASTKMSSLFIVFAEEKRIDGIRKYHYKKAKIFLNFDFNKFLDEIESGGIMFDLRMGVYNSGKYYGKPHDHGSGFRIKKENIKNLFQEEITID